MGFYWKDKKDQVCAAFLYIYGPLIDGLSYLLGGVVNDVVEGRHTTPAATLTIVCPRTTVELVQLHLEEHEHWRTTQEIEDPFL